MAPVTRNLTILMTDIKGFTDKTSHKSRAAIQVLLDKHKELVLPALEGKGGKLVKTMGDAFLMTFESPTDAVLAGIDVQKVLRGYNAGKPSSDRIEVRVAINQGEVNLLDNDVFGEPVNIAARIEAVADAGEVLFTDAVYLSMNKQEVPSSEVGLLRLKGIPEKVRVYRVIQETPSSAHGEDARPVSRERKAVQFGVGAVVVVAALAAFALYAFRPKHDLPPPVPEPEPIVKHTKRASTLVEQYREICKDYLEVYCPEAQSHEEMMACLMPHGDALSYDCAAVTGVIVSGRKRDEPAPKPVKSILDRIK